MELYFNPMSGCSRRVLALLSHLDIPYLPKPVDLNSGEQAQASYLAINPNGRVPTLVEGTRSLWESAAILRRLAREFAPALLGEGREEDEVNRWVAWTLSHLSPTLSRLNAETGLKRMRGLTINPTTVSEIQKNLRPLLTLLNTHLTAQKYLAGERHTIAEFTAVPSLEASLALAKLDLAQYPAMARWIADSKQLKGWPAAAGKPS